MGIVQKFGAPKPVSALLNWSRKYSLWMFQFGLVCCADHVLPHASAQFATPAAPAHLGERRTVHLGIDLFAEVRP